jgi:hypothetical protein
LLKLKAENDKKCTLYKEYSRLCGFFEAGFEHCSQIIWPANMLWEIKVSKIPQICFLDAKDQFQSLKCCNIFPPKKGKTFTSSKEIVWLRWIQPHPVHLYKKQGRSKQILADTKLKLQLK